MPAASPTIVTLTREIAQLKEQVTSLWRLVSKQHAPPRDTSIEAFCLRHGISRGTYLNLRKSGKTPREAAVGLRRIITEEAEADWVREREAEAATIAEQRKTDGSTEIKAMAGRKSWDRRKNRTVTTAQRKAACMVSLE
jgi:hypothetical protein